MLTQSAILQQLLSHHKLPNVQMKSHLGIRPFFTLCKVEPVRMLPEHEWKPTVAINQHQAPYSCVVATSHEEQLH